MNKPVVGQTIYVLDGRRGNNSSQLIPMTVTKVGRMYYTAGRQNGNAPGIQFRIEDGMENTEAGTVRQAYFNEQEYLDEQERLRLFRQLQKCFEWMHGKEYTLGQLRQVCAILEIDGRGKHRESGDCRCQS